MTQSPYHRFKTHLLQAAVLAISCLPSGGATEQSAPSVEYAFTHTIDASDVEARILEKAAKVLPRPAQTSWMRLEQTFFLHFGPNTFRGVEWGDGHESPSLFNPSALSADQWLDTVKDAGGKLLIMVAKHHDGFCLWPSRYTGHSIASSPWKGGGGDLLSDVATAARARGIKLGIYLSPADLYQLRTNGSNASGLYGNGSAKRPSVIPSDPHFFLTDPSRGRPPRPGFGAFQYEVDDYNRYFLNQLYELLTEYGPISAVWFDGANPDPSVKETYDYSAWYDMIHRLQPDAVISVKGPDVRWVGNEGGHGRTTEWSVIPLSEAPDKHGWPDRQANDLGSRAQLKPGTHLWWYPAEVNTPILNGWFWSPDKRTKSPAELVDYYYRSVGRNGNMLLNLSPDNRGLIPEDQLAALGTMSKVISTTFATDLATGATLSANSEAVGRPAAAAHDGNLDSWWEASAEQASPCFTLVLPRQVSFDIISLQEAVDHRGQRIEEFVVEIWNGQDWSAPSALEESTTVGHKRLLRLAKPATSSKVRIRILRSRLSPTLAEVGLFKQSLPREPLISERSREGFVTISHAQGLPIVYTLDGSEPTTKAPLYTGPLALPAGGVVNAAVITEDGRVGLVASRAVIGIAPTGWKVVGDRSLTGSDTLLPADNSIDADPSTCWREKAAAPGDRPPALTVDMGVIHEIEGFAYLPRQDWVFVGIADRFRFETSEDGQLWVPQVVEGRFGNIRNNPTLQEVRFPSRVRARFFRFVALHDVDDNGWVGAAEITVLPAPTESCNTPQNGSPARRTTSLDDDWQFHLGLDSESRAAGKSAAPWRHVDVPHDYVIEEAFTEKDPVGNPQLRPDWYWLHAFLPVRKATYRKSFHLSSEETGRRLWLEFDGVASNSRYWLNGRELGCQPSGYTPSRFDITGAANCGGDNELIVELDPRYDGWWYEGAGIYRHVRLVSSAPVHIAPDGILITSTLTSPALDHTGDADVRVKAEVGNNGPASASVSLLGEILDPEGMVVAQSVAVRELGVASGETVALNFSLPRAKLWSTQHPTLYRLRSTVLVNGKKVDQVLTSFGVRKASFDAERGFLLNDQRLRLQGVNMHQDHAGVGVAVPDRLFTWRLERLKEMGCNAIRLSHNPVSPFLLDECDRLGFVVIAENRHLGDSMDDQADKNAVAVAHRDLTTLVKRDRNHPSIILWSLCNEQWIQGTPESAAMARAMRARVLELDPSRPITAAMNGGFDSPSGLGSALDVIGINYNPSVYDSVHRLFPGTPLVATEIASEICTRGVYATEHWEDYFGDPKRGYVSAYSISAGPAGQTVENAWPPVATRPFIAGGFVWAAFDYKGEPRPFGWPVINCHYGFMDICGFPKDSYYYYKALWTEEPVLHLFPHWNWSGREGQEIPVWVHSNCEEVELFLNGQSLGRRQMPALGHLEWMVRYAPGKLVAVGKRKGAVIEDSRETTSAPTALRLTADRTRLTANNADLAVVKVEIVDAAGRLVPIADNRIRFSVTGPGKIIGVGNGDPSSHEPDKAPSRSAFNGLAQVLVQATKQPGDLTLQAECEGLQKAVVVIQSR